MTGENVTAEFFDKNFGNRPYGTWAELGRVRTRPLPPRFGYFDFRRNFLNLSRNGAILPKILCRIQIWVSKIEIQIGQMTSGFKLKF